MFNIEEHKLKNIGVINFGVYKKLIIEKFLKQKTIKVSKKMDLFDVIFCWGYFNKDSYSQSKSIICVEDGFIRSIGLGVEIAKPLSWIFDSKGIYYDSHNPSDLEVILNKIKLDEGMKNRIENVKELILKNKLSKYNLDSKPSYLKYHKDNILVIGQVDQDLSIKHGANLAINNLDLLRKVKEDFPKSNILYKPHPDYESGLRNNNNKNNDFINYTSATLQNISIIESFKLSDTVIVNTSLAGFEALIRGKKVICYGEPFYAGWGLTIDKKTDAIRERRTRNLSLDELMYGSLISYPNYFHPGSYKPAEIEDVLLSLSSTRYKMRLLNRLKTKLLNILVRIKNMLNPQ